VVSEGEPQARGILDGNSGLHFCVTRQHGVLASVSLPFLLQVISELALGDMTWLSG
jgi:hypothetical protein